ncbi:hypothetical protein TIFTF001_037699 [Ficus carica]|uniref:Uncharacterized protein n=1 Tax=Ficus carica TaxID=3494 RepID=A0AA88JCX1_FICCA|nr:hypothetical protein TIFTF001_037699 [Ficus carica]
MDFSYLFVVSSPYQGSCFAKQRVAVFIKLERSWVVVSRFGIGFRHIIDVVRIIEGQPGSLYLDGVFYSITMLTCSVKNAVFLTWCFLSMVHRSL